jgi:anti-anti-sigma regulatory factor
MLMITRTEGSHLVHTLKLQGKLLGPWLGELETACRAPDQSTDCVYLDLSELNFVDAQGARFLEALIRKGAKVIACSAFVAEILQLDRHS